MTRFLLIFILAIFRVETAKDSLNCNSVEIKSTTRRLQNHLFCEYDSRMRPYIDKDSPTVVDIHMLPQYVEFYERRNQLNFYVWLGMSWVDVHLTWEPEKWDDIDEIYVKSKKIWMPDLTVFNNGDGTKNNIDMSPFDCLIKFNGSVKCVVPSKYTSHCLTDYTEWPYDKHDCTIQIGAWLYERNEMLLKFGNDSIMMNECRANRQWRVHVQSKTPKFYRRPTHEDGELSIFVNVLLQRHGSRLTMFYILPIIVLMVLTLVVLCLDAQSFERIIVACINFVCHLIGMSDLSYNFPTNGSRTIPKIVSFYQTSIGLAAFALIFTCLVRKLRGMTIPAPTWIVSFTKLIMSSSVINLLRSNSIDRARNREENENNEESREATKDHTWQELSIILERTSFIVVLLAYIIMLVIVLPPKEPPTFVKRFWV